MLSECCHTLAAATGDCALQLVFVVSDLTVLSPDLSAVLCCVHTHSQACLRAGCIPAATAPSCARTPRSVTGWSASLLTPWMSCAHQRTALCRGLRSA